MRDWKVEPIQLHIRPRSEQGTPRSVAGDRLRTPFHALFNSLQDGSNTGRAAAAQGHDAASGLGDAVHRRANSATLPLTAASVWEPDSSNASESQPHVSSNAQTATAASASEAGMLPLPAPDDSIGPASISLGGGGGGAHGNSPDRWFGRHHGASVSDQLRDITRSPASPQVCFALIVLSAPMEQHSCSSTKVFPVMTGVKCGADGAVTSHRSHTAGVSKRAAACT